MRGAVLHELGKTPRYEEFPDPAAGEGEVIVQVRAASLKPVDKQLASGSHYACPRELPVICGIDGVGHLSDGQRVFFGGPRPPYGAMSERTVVARALAFPLSDKLSDETAAALPNPGVSAWLSLTYRAKLVPGENVLILGATGVTGKLAVQIAKALGAGRVVAAGRNQEVLNGLHDHGADATIRLDVSAQELTDVFSREAAEFGFNIVIDYVWGRPAEIFLASVAQDRFTAIKCETRFVQVGESAGSTISLPAAVLRSAPLTVLGTAGIPPRDILADAFREVMGRAEQGELRVDTERIPLMNVESAWERDQHGSRFVLIP